MLSRYPGVGFLLHYVMQSKMKVVALKFREIASRCVSRAIITKAWIFHTSYRSPLNRIAQRRVSM